MDLTIIGAGAMGMALANGLESRYNIEFVVRDILKYSHLKDRFTFKKLEGFDISNKRVILAIKPVGLSYIKSRLRGEADTIYSVLAGVSLESLKDAIDSKYYIRAMPNISAKFRKSTTTITGDLKRRDEAVEIFSMVGDVFWVDSQREVDISTAIAGSGPAFLALVAESMGDGLVREGLSRDLSTKIVASLFDGFAPLIKNTHPAEIKDSVMSPAGTTARGYYALEERGVRGAFIKAVEEAHKILKK